ncbi:S8 family serine peptidase [Heliophilum fasciatum]|uniref:Subtilisin family serine protease n=1 Tax=Heliophilum fasciatum TaxID=35700 RepID=A0A4R2RMM4_9FIRM|nr:S8 family serine peptidase [Heliophilum fasciatum]MCW2277457.1 hypothetical protein [Heliophilum fasciatum]TCP65252.1 subtilisin family serine protease [Heliophilum fasciatum]
MPIQVAKGSAIALRAVLSLSLFLVPPLSAAAGAVSLEVPAATGGPIVAGPAVGLEVSTVTGNHGVAAAVHPVGPVAAAPSVDPATDRSAAPSARQLLSDRARDMTGANALAVPGWLTRMGLTGEGELVALADSGLDSGNLNDLHPDFRSAPGRIPRVVMLRSWSGRAVPRDQSGHGTHMAGLIAGSGAASGGKYRGMAPGASLYVQDIVNEAGRVSPPARLDDLFYPAYSAGARIHVDGWGGESNYQDSSAQIDTFVRRYPDMLIIYGAGNNGPQPGSVTAEGASKNALTVGASQSPRPAFDQTWVAPDQPVELSSRGPTSDGRIKPEILAPGDALIAPRARDMAKNFAPNDAYARMQGTSMAAAVTGGATALLRGYLRQSPEPQGATGRQNSPGESVAGSRSGPSVGTRSGLSVGNRTGPEGDTRPGPSANPPSEPSEGTRSGPSAALLKALLINGGQTPSSGPTAGGLAGLDIAGTVLALAEKTMTYRDETQGLHTGEERLYPITIYQSGQPLKITLAWTDPAGRTDGSTLVNDLDVSIITPDGKALYGNHFLGQAGADRQNNVEHIYLPSPQPGTYQIKVRASAVRALGSRGARAALAPEPSQDYALVYGQAVEKQVLREGSTSQGKPLLHLDGGGVLTPEQGKIKLAVDGVLVPYNPDQPPLGGDVYHIDEAVYIAARRWRPAGGVQAVSDQGQTMLLECGPLTREGGYYVNPGALVRINRQASTVQALPTGAEVMAWINPARQTIWHVDGAYREVRGILQGIDRHGNTVRLLRDNQTYMLEPAMIVTYEDRRIGESSLPPLAVDGASPLPGMSVRLLISPTSGKVQHLSIQRAILQGPVQAVDPQAGTITLEDGKTYPLLAGAQVIHDGQAGDLTRISPGSVLSAVVLPDTGTIIELHTWSDAQLRWGQMAYLGGPQATLLFAPARGTVQHYTLDSATTVWRWGMTVEPANLPEGGWGWLYLTPPVPPGSRPPEVTPVRSAIERVETVETATAQGRWRTWNAATGELRLDDDHRYRAGERMVIQKNSYPVQLEDLRAGEKVQLITLLPTGTVPAVAIAAKAQTLPGVTVPPLQVAAVQAGQRLFVAGHTKADQVYLYGQEGQLLASLVPDQQGRFNRPLAAETAPPLIRVVAVDRATGGVNGQYVSIPAIGHRDFPDIQGHPLEKEIRSLAEAGIVQGDEAGRFHPDNRLTRLELLQLLVRTMGWQKQEQTNVVKIPDYVPSWAGDVVTMALRQGLLHAEEMVALQGPVQSQEALALCRRAVATILNESAILPEWMNRDPSAPLTRAQGAQLMQSIRQFFAGQSEKKEEKGTL